MCVGVCVCVCVCVNTNKLITWPCVCQCLCTLCSSLLRFHICVGVKNICISRKHTSRMMVPLCILAQLQNWNNSAVDTSAVNLVVIYWNRQTLLMLVLKGFGERMGKARRNVKGCLYFVCLHFAPCFGVIQWRKFDNVGRAAFWGEIQNLMLGKRESGTTKTDPNSTLPFRASLIFVNNCPTRCNTKQSIYYSASSI